MRGKVVRLIITVFALGLLSGTSLRQVLKLKTPPPDIIVFFDASGLFNESISFERTFTYTYKVERGRRIPQYYYWKAEQDLRRWISRNYPGADYNILSRSYSLRVLRWGTLIIRNFPEDPFYRRYGISVQYDKRECSVKTYYYAPIYMILHDYANKYNSCTPCSYCCSKRDIRDACKIQIRPAFINFLNTKVKQAYYRNQNGFQDDYPMADWSRLQVSSCGNVSCEVKACKVYPRRCTEFVHIHRAPLYARLPYARDLQITVRLRVRITREGVREDFVPYKNAIRDFVLNHKNDASFWVFVSGGKKNTGSVPLTLPTTPDWKIKSQFSKLQPAGKFAFALGLAELRQLLRASRCIACREGAPVPEMGISAITENYSEPYHAWCQPVFIVAIAASPDSSSRDRAYGDMENMDFDGDCGGKTESWSSMGDDLAYFYATFDQKAALEEKQLVNTFVVGYKYNSDYYKATASRGGGQYYFAASVQELSAKLEQIFNEIKNIVQTSTYTDRYIPFDPVLLKAKYAYEYGFKGTSPEGWKGLKQGVLRLYEIEEGGINWDSPAMDLVEKARQRRSVYILTEDGRFVKASELPDTFYQRYGWSKDEFLGFLQVYKNIGLSAIISQPEPVYPPYIFLSGIIHNQTYINQRLNRFAIFVADNVALHLFDQETGNELWTVIPAEELPNIKRLRTQEVEIFTGKTDDADVFVSGEDQIVHMFFAHSVASGKIYGIRVDDLAGMSLQSAAEYEGPYEYTDYPVRVIGGRHCVISHRGNEVLIYEAATSSLVQTLSFPAEVNVVVGMDRYLKGDTTHIFLGLENGQIWRVSVKENWKQELFLTGAPAPFRTPFVIGGDGISSFLVMAISSEYGLSAPAEVYIVKEPLLSNLPPVEADQLREYDFGEQIPKDVYLSADFKGYRIPLGDYRPVRWQRPRYFNGIFYALVGHESDSAPLCSAGCDMRVIAFHPVENAIVQNVHMVETGVKFKIIRRAGLGSLPRSSKIVSAFPSQRSIEIPKVRSIIYLWKYLYKAPPGSGNPWFWKVKKEEEKRQ